LVSCTVVVRKYQGANMATKKKSTKKTTTTEPQDEYTAQPEAAAPVVDANEPPEVKTGPTLADAAASYLAGLDADGAGDGTISSYGAELKMAMKHLGAETLLEDLSIDAVAAFYKSDAVTKTRTGKVKSQLTIDKTRRVLRLALLWAQDKNMIAAAPIPTLSKT
jgi:hypothetical protein